MAWVANRSTTVRKAVRPMMRERTNRPTDDSCIAIGESVMRISTVCDICDMALLPLGKCDVMLSCHWSITSGVPSSAARSHVVVRFVVQHVADVQHDGLVAEVLPPMGCAARLWADIARLVHD